MPSLAKASLISLTAAAAFLPAVTGRPNFANETTAVLQRHHDGASINGFTQQQQQPFVLVRAPYPADDGMPPQFKVRPVSWPSLRKRQCLANGTNFCFGNDVDSCPDCGGCCALDGDQWCCKDAAATCCPGQKCCEAGTTCCGDGCCGDGESCNNGQCEVPIVTSTTTTTVHTTLTTTEVEMVTVQNIVVETSTINSIITKTVTSTDGTQTEVTFSTTTVVAPAKRSLLPTTVPADQEVLDDDEQQQTPIGLVTRIFTYLWRGLVYGGDQVPFDPTINRISPTERRQCTSTLTHLIKRQGDGTSTVWVTMTSFVTDHTTVQDTRSTTVKSTSVFRTTIFQTSTKVIGATATVSTVSVVTITSRTATTNTITSTSTFLVDPTDAPASSDPRPDDSDPALNDPSGGSGTKKKKGLSNSAVVGIGVGAGLVGLTLLIVALFFWRRHKKNKQPRVYDFNYAPAPQMTSPTPPSPRKPTLPFGAGAVPGSHHDTSYTPTLSEMYTDPTSGDGNGYGQGGSTPGSGGQYNAGAAAAGGAVMGGAAAAAATRHTHRRNNSSISNPQTALMHRSGDTSPDPYNPGNPFQENSQSAWSNGNNNAAEMPSESRYELGEDQPQQPPATTPPPPPRNQFRTGPHPSTSSISRVTRFAELDGSGHGRIT